MSKGKLMVIGGAEDKEGPCLILRKFLDLAGGDKARLVVLTAATQSPEEVGKMYRKIFTGLGCKEVELFDVDDRTAASSQKTCSLIEEATGIFFTGGDQLRITSALGGTKLMETLKAAFDRGLVIAGTSAGASVMSSTMIIEGDSDDSPQLNTLKMSPGIGLLPGVVIDQHFAQRGRIGRLLTALGQNPSVLGLGLDEDTSVIVEGEEFQVWGNQTVTILDGQDITHTNASLDQPTKHLALTGVKVHVLPHAYRFNLATREPMPASWKKKDMAD